MVLAFVGFDKGSDSVQLPLAEQGILWLVVVIPAALLVVALMIISRYELTDERIDEINREIERRRNV